MNKNLPDKWIRKAIFDAVKLTVTDNIFDSRQDETATGFKQPYVLMSVQSNNVENTKCEDYYTSDILLEIVSISPLTGSAISRAQTEDLLDEVRAVLNPLIVLDPTSNLKVITQLMTFPSDLTTVGVNKNIVRKFLRLNLKIQ